MVRKLFKVYVLGVSIYVSHKDFVFRSRCCSDKSYFQHERWHTSKVNNTVSWNICQYLIKSLNIKQFTNCICETYWKLSQYSMTELQNQVGIAVGLAA